ncbi:MAG: hypothetical protein WC378_08200 [Opitutaceae bacterium]|jgi:predicted nucleic acid-binding protein
MADGVLLDTSFLISFVDPNRPQHAVAVQYYKHFIDESVPMFLSTIAASEFHLKQPVTDLPLDTFIPLPFNLPDAMTAAELDFTKFKGTPNVSRDRLKDDFKILGQAKQQDIAFLITEDDHTLYKFCLELRKTGQLRTRPIKLIDGFDKSHFDPNGQHTFDVKLESQSD